MAKPLPNSHGGILLRTLSDPIAGQPVDLTLNGTNRIRLQSVRVTLVTDATAANRNVFIDLIQTATTFLRIFANLTQTASQTITYNFALQGPDRSAALANEINVQLPDILIRDAAIVGQINANNLQAGDNFGAALQLTEEWIEL